MRNTALLVATVVFALTACSVPVEHAQERIRPLVERAAEEIRKNHDRQFRTWRALRDLDRVYACILSKGAIDRNATDEEREAINAVDCGSR